MKELFGAIVQRKKRNLISTEESDILAKALTEALKEVFVAPPVDQEDIIDQRCQKGVLSLYGVNKIVAQQLFCKKEALLSSIKKSGASHIREIRIY